MTLMLSPQSSLGSQALRLKHSISISRRSIMKPSEPIIWHTFTPRLISKHAVPMAAAIESHCTGVGTSMQKIVYVTTLGNLALAIHERSFAPR